MGMDIWTAAMWVGKVGFVLFFVMSGVNHLVNHKGMTAYAQSKHIPLPGVAVGGSGPMMLAGWGGIFFFWSPGWGAGGVRPFLLPAAVFGCTLSGATDAVVKVDPTGGFCVQS